MNRTPRPCLVLMAFGPFAAFGGDSSVSNPDPLPILKEPNPGTTWILDERFSDEFNTDVVDEVKWERDLRPWGERAWRADNVFQEDGSLVIRARYEPHQVREQRYFYTFGILRSRAKTTYGYFEARIKGCSRFPGLCPGFWLYSYGADRNPRYPQVAYSEIDIVEMLQGLYVPDLKRQVGVEHIDLNLHTRLFDEQGDQVWVRPNHRPDICRGYWTAPWDPREDYHLYACENTPETITWYIDGVKVAEKENLYWHLPMSITLTMEARPPLIAWAGEDGRIPVPEAATPEGFPTRMLVDYVRCWMPKTFRPLDTRADIPAQLIP